MRPSLRKQNPKQAKGRGRSAAQSPGTLWEKLGQRGEVFWGPESPPPNYRLGGLFEDSLRGNKTQKWRSVDGDWWMEKGTSHQPESIVPDSPPAPPAPPTTMHEWVTHHSARWHYFNFPGIIISVPQGLAHRSLRGKYGYRRFTQDFFITSAP